MESSQLVSQDPLAVEFRKLLLRRRDFFDGSWEKKIHSMMGGVYVLDGIGSSLFFKEAS